MAYAFIGTIVHIYEQWFPVRGQGGVINGIAVILGRDETLRASHTLHWLVVGTVTVFQLVGLRPCRTCQQLVTQADAHAGTHRLIIEELADMLHRDVAALRVARTVGKEEAVELKLVEVIVPRHTNHLDAPAQQAADDIGLNATIDKNDARK